MTSDNLSSRGRAATHRAAVLTGLAGLAALLLLVTTAMAAPRAKADLSRLVVVGDSISAGHQNGSLLASQQVNGYASLVARQAGVAVPPRPPRMGPESGRRQARGAAPGPPAPDTRLERLCGFSVDSEVRWRTIWGK